jgi:sigma-B regulation protein RsbU (phosphoserine phosphatase)
VSEDSQLLSRVRQLERQLIEKEQDIVFFQNELQKVNQKLEQLVLKTQQELKIATKIHKFLVPTEFPNIPGFEFSTKFLASPKSGGDYFDVFDHPGKMKFGGVVSSASGYALSALMMSVLLKYTGMRLLADCKTAAEAVEQMKKDIDDAMDESGSINLVYFIVDRKKYNLSLSVIGGAVVYFYDYHNNDLKELEANADKIQLGDQQKMTSHELPLNPRDRLIICSPGFFELTNLNDEKFSKQALKKNIQSVIKNEVHQVKNEILFQAEKFASGVEAPRDRTVVVMEVKDRVIKLAKG